MIFKNNKYTKWYNSIIQNAVNQESHKYKEKHHIIPRSLGGDDSSENIIELSPRQHFVCHLLLTKMTEGDNKRKMCWALHWLTFSKENDYWSSRQYEFARNAHINSLKNDHHSKRIPGWNERMSKMVKESWKQDEKRKKSFSDRMKKEMTRRKKEDPLFYEKQRKAAISGAKAVKEKAIKNKPLLEYKGKYYKGWEELKEITEVSKYLYKKYYMNGIDPETRIKANGPVPKFTSTA